MDDVKIITGTLFKAPADSAHLDRLQDYEWVRSHLGIRIVNFKMNVKILETIPHVPFLDLAAVIGVNVEETERGVETVLVQQSHMEKWNVTWQQLLGGCRKNMRAENTMKLMQIEDAVMPADNKEKNDADEEPCMPIYVLCNDRKINGAAAILSLNVMRHCTEKLNGRFYVLPSSVNELILVPEDKVTCVIDLIHMVREINLVGMDFEEVLSNNIYIFDGNTDVLYLLDIEEDGHGNEKPVVRMSISLKDGGMCDFDMA